MGLWLKKDGEFIPVSGGSGGDGSEPHDHDYLPLSGGTLTGDLEIDGVIKARKGGSAPDPSYSFGDGDGLGMYSHIANGWLRFAVGGEQRMQINSERVIVNNDLRVDSNLNVTGNIKPQANGTPSNPGILFGDDGAGIYGANDFVGFTQGGTWQFYATANVVRIKPNLQVDSQIIAKSAGTSAEPAIGFDGISGMGIYTHKANNWLRFAVGGAQRMNIREDAIIMDGNLQVGGVIQLPNARTDDIEVSAAPNLYLTSNGNVRFTTFNAAPRTFNIAEDIDTADVLDRAETATMPVVDDEGVATTDAEVESITVNEVVTALLAKVKELSARIEELEGA